MQTPRAAGRQGVVDAGVAPIAARKAGVAPELVAPGDSTADWKGSSQGFPGFQKFAPDMDVMRTTFLRKEMAKLPLNGYFNDHGAPRFEAPGVLSFAAKQNLGIDFGSRSEIPIGDPANRDVAPGRALAAIEAKDRDQEACELRRSQLSASVPPDQRYRIEDVNFRQLEVIFSGIPRFEQWLPSWVRKLELLPPELERGAEWQNRLVVERENGTLRTMTHETSAEEIKKEGWLFSFPEMLAILQVSNLWLRAVHGQRCPLGFDRPTFCRFLLDLGLVDQSKAPFHWATSLFDDLALSVPVAARGQPDGVAVLNVLGWRPFLSVFSHVLRKHFGASSGTKSSLLSSFLSVAKFRLPEHIIEESGVQDSDINNLLSGIMPARMAQEGSGQATGEQFLEFMVQQETAYTEVSDAEAQTSASLQEPELPMPHVDFLREEMMREQRLRCLMVEPEVLHVLAVYQPVFRQLHGCYSKDGNMTFAEFQQFCVDFNLSPTLHTSRQLREIYKSVESLDLLDHAGNTRAALQIVYEQASSGSGSTPPAQDELPWKRVATLASIAAKRRKEADEAETKKRMAEKKKMEGGRASPYGRSSPLGRRSPKSDLDSEGRRTPVATTSGQRPKNKRAGSFLRQVSPRQRLESPSAQNNLDDNSSRGCFGPNAFLEALCRVAFIWLGSFGNNRQQRSGGYARVMWMLAYVREVHCQLQNSMERHPESVRGQLQKALQTVPQSAWDEPPMIEERLTLLPPTMMRDKVDRDPTQPKRRDSSQGAGPVAKQASERAVAATQNPASKESAEESAANRGRLLESTRDMLIEASSDGRLAAELQKAATAAAETKPEQKAEGSKFHLVVKTALLTKKVSRFPVGQEYVDSQPNSPTRTPEPVEPPERSSSKRKKKAAPALLEQEAVRRHGGVASSTECVVDGVCRLCGSPAGPGIWGNPRCRGCSLVDRLTLSEHVLKPLLMDWFPQQAPAKPLVPAVSMTQPLSPSGHPACTPPQMSACMADALRGADQLQTDWATNLRT